MELVFYVAIGVLCAYLLFLMYKQLGVKDAPSETSIDGPAVPEMDDDDALDSAGPDSEVERVLLQVDRIKKEAMDQELPNKITGLYAICSNPDELNQNAVQAVAGLACTMKKLADADAAAIQLNGVGFEIERKVIQDLNALSVVAFVLTVDTIPKFAMHVSVQPGTQNVVSADITRFLSGPWVEDVDTVYRAVEEQLNELEMERRNSPEFLAELKESFGLD